ncbi:MAG TPA: matrixin family metalloprotease, partial [Chthoniobacterales bacterium]
MKNRLSLAIVALTALGGAAAYGYALESASWTPNRTVVMHLSLPPGTHTFQDGFHSLGESAADALKIWNQYLNHMKFAVDQNSLLPPAGSDGDTSVSLSDTVYGDTFGSGVLAVTLTTYGPGSPMLEADTIFNSAITFDSYRGPLQSAVDFHRVALHEFGHVIGLDHPDQATPKQNVAAIMNSMISDIDSLQPDDIAGARSLYSNGPAYQNSVPAPNLVNLSTRAFVGTGDNVLIGGFIVQGSQPATMILRGIGHSLRAQGIEKPLTDPTMSLYDANNALLATSDDWVDGPDATTIAGYHLDPPNTYESALLATL